MFTVINGPMFSGKTTELCTIYRKLKYKFGNNIYLFRYENDTRYSTDDKILSHDKISEKAIIITDTDSITKKYISDGTKALFFDELQFFDKSIIKIIKNALIAGIDVYASMLSSKCVHCKDPKIPELFDNYIGLKPLVTKEIVKTAFCDFCSNGEATMHYKYCVKYDSFGDEIWIGSKEFYKPICIKCLDKLIKK